MGIGICLGIIAVIFLGDMWIKDRMERTLVDGETQERLGGRILLRIHHNRGAMLNAGQNMRKAVAVLSAGLTAAALAVFLFSLGRRGNHLLCLGLAFLLGGAFSNTYDRLKRKYVVDYVSFGVKWKGLRSVVFNISDFCIIIGALMAALGAGR